MLCRVKQFQCDSVFKCSKFSASVHKIIIDNYTIILLSNANLCNG